MRFLKPALLGACAGWIAIDVYMAAVYAAYSGGWATGTLGLVLDFIVSFAWAALAVYAMQHLSVARRHPFAFGIALGILVMCVMVYGLVPLGHARQAPITLRGILIMLAGHTLFFGVPVVYGSRATALRQQLREA